MNESEAPRGRASRLDREASVSCPERELGVQAAKVLGMLAAPVIGAAGLVAGRPGVAGAAVGLGLVFVLFTVSGLLVAAVGRRGSSAALGVAGGAAFARLALYALVLSALDGVEGLHRPSLAAATAGAFLITLAYEIRVVSRTPHLNWVRAG